MQCGVSGGAGRLLWFIDTTLNIDTERGRLVDSRYLGNSHFKPFETMFKKQLERVTKIYLTVPQSIYLSLFKKRML